VPALARPAVRDGAALTLGRLGSREAVGALVEALGRDDLKVREEAIRLLGSLRDPRATEPLIETIAEDRTRYLSVLALGKIGDPRAYDTLMDVLEHETHTDVRGYAVVALGWLGMPEAIPRLLRILEEEPEIKWTAEALARLGAVGRAPLWGVAAAPGAAGLGRGFGGCREKARVIDGEFLDRAACATKGPSAELSFAAAAPRGAEVILRARHLLEDGGERRTISIAIDGRAAGSAEIGAEAETARFPLGFGLPEGEHRAVLRMEGSGAFELDHFLLLAPAKP